jgi:hypothetical protein
MLSKSKRVSITEVRNTVGQSKDAQQTKLIYTRAWKLYKFE